MDRRAWLAERRAAVQAQYDDEAPGYDAEEHAYPVPRHSAFVERLIEQITNPETGWGPMWAQFHGEPWAHQKGQDP